MLPENNKNEYRFDEMLKKSLKKHREPVRQDFAQELLAKIQKLEQQKALAKVVRQERAAWAALILLPMAGVILVLIFPNLLLVPTQLYGTIYLLAKETAANMVQQWQLWTGYAVIAAIMIYAVYGVLLADN
jgi:hypothetical protein